MFHQDDIAIYALEFFKQFYPEQLADRYQLTQEDLAFSTAELLMLITKKQGFQDDYDKGSQRIIHDVREGKLGKYTLDRL